MPPQALTFSHDQAEAFDAISAALKSAGVDLDEGLTTPIDEDGSGVLAVVGKAGSGKTMLLAHLFAAVSDAGAGSLRGYMAALAGELSSTGFAVLR